MQFMAFSVDVWSKAELGWASAARSRSTQQHQGSSLVALRGQDFCTSLTFLGLPALVQPAATHNNSSISIRIPSCETSQIP